MSKKNPLTPTRHNVLVGAIGGAIVWTISVFTSGDALSKWGHSFWLIVAVALVVTGLYFTVKAFNWLRHHEGQKASDFLPKTLLLLAVVGATFVVFAVVTNWLFGSSFRTSSHLSAIVPSGNLFAGGGLAGWMYLLLLLAVLWSLFYKRNGINREDKPGKADKVQKPPRQKREKLFQGFRKNPGPRRENPNVVPAHEVDIEEFLGTSR
jgi:hypothetical protein